MSKVDNTLKVNQPPSNTQADFKEIDARFRKRLDNMIPSDLAQKIEEIRNRRLEKNKDPGNAEVA